MHALSLKFDNFFSHFGCSRTQFWNQHNYHPSNSEKVARGGSSNATMLGLLCSKSCYLFALYVDLLGGLRLQMEMLIYYNTYSH
ncbi:unnamed protein product [Lupinus luteus]|uniref:Uncharacterized protein n=1 Tax=Lupinus luteus TaxID=3873 RepID=A0AAV1VPN0_LUPLU